LIQGGTLELTLGATPNKRFGVEHLNEMKNAF
jgi:putative alpha-1,2-mannosidase